MYKKLQSIDVNLIKKYQTTCPSSANKIIIFYSKRIEAAIKSKYSTTNLGSYIGIDDLIQEGHIHFIDAANNFEIKNLKDGKTNIDQFFNFCMKKTNWRLLDYVRLLSRRHNIASTNLISGTEDEQETSDLMPDVILQKLVKKSLTLLSNRDRIICKEMIENGELSKDTISNSGLHKTYCLSIYRDFKKELISNANKSAV